MEHRISTVPNKEMLTLGVITLVFFVAFLILLGMGKRQEITDNWPKYRAHPLYMMTAFLYKPAADPRSRFEFMQDNFNAVMNQAVTDAFQAALAPLLEIFQLSNGGIIGSIGGVKSIESILQTMKDSFQQITSLFDNRYKATLHRLAMTFHRIQTSMERIWGVAVNSVYQSIASISAILSTLDLIIKIIIIILTILVAIVLFLFLFLWPVIPVILGVIGILVTAGAGAAVGGMAGTFCFEGSTPVILQDGTTRPISRVKLGDALAGGATVTGRLEFQQYVGDLYDLQGIRVTGSHIVFHEGQPIHVADHPAAKKLPPAYMRVYCLNTTTHRIPVHTRTGTFWFADWEELGEDAPQQALWNRHVFEHLNPGTAWRPSAATGEAGFHPATMVQTGPQQWTEISRLRPGDQVLDEEERPTRVLGVVELAAGEVEHVTGCMSAAVWRRRGARDCWEQGQQSVPAAHHGSWHSLVTEAGTFRLITGERVRDFTDVGIQHIQGTYGWVLEALAKTGA
jgi:hypothetical protein